MALFLNLRTKAVGGSVVDKPYLLEGDAMVSPPAVAAVPFAAIADKVRDRNVLFVAHGFNVSYDSGARAAARLADTLAPSQIEVIIGVLWPGDFWVPVVNYPFAGDPAIQGGQRLAAFCNAYLGEARSLSFVSHSLGARVVLEAVKDLDSPARLMCLTAGAVNSDCLATEYAASVGNAQTVVNLASTSDKVLQLAFPLGDIIADILHPDHWLGTPALGFWGPKKPVPGAVAHARIPQDQCYDHGNYMPPGVVIVPPDPDSRWRNVATFIGRAFRGQPQNWP
jgi:hypothetical protein